MLQLEVVSLGGQHLPVVAVDQAQLEQSLVVALHLVPGQGSELLVGGETRRSNIVGHQERVGPGVEELDDIVVADDPSTTSLRESLGGDNDPVVVLVFMGITSDLLTLTADSLVGIIAGVALRVRVQQVLGAHVLDRNRVKVTNFCRRKSINSPVRTAELNAPWLFINSSLPIKVSWNAGDMKVSPGPEWVRIVKWIQKKKR